MSEENPVLISLNDVVRMTSLSRTAINRWREKELFPKPLPLGERRIAFVRAEVEQWIRDRIAARPKRDSIFLGRPKKAKAAQSGEASVPGHEA